MEFSTLPVKCGIKLACTTRNLSWSIFRFSSSLRITLDKRLWELFLVIVRIIADILEIDADDLLKKNIDKSGGRKVIESYFRKQVKEAC